MTSMKMFSVFSVFGFFNSVIARDYVLEAYNRNVNHSSDPCDDFYRHYCPLNEGMLFRNEINKDVEWVMSKTLKLGFFQTDIKRDLGHLIEQRGKFYSNVDNFASYIDNEILDHFENLCLNHQNSSLFLSILHELSPIPDLSTNLPDLSEDSNCSNTREILVDYLGAFRKIENVHFNHFQVDIFELEEIYQTHELYAAANVIYADDGINRAIFEIDSYLKKMLSIVKKWAEHTPWLINSGTEEAFDRIIQKMNFQANVFGELSIMFDEFLAIEKTYLKCKNGLQMTNEAEIIICACHALKNKTDKILFLKEMFLPFSAFNTHPSVHLSFALLRTHSQLVDEASKIGLIGSILGHELSHSIIKNYNRENLFLPYFSENVRNCIQKQFNSTCEEFSEIDTCVALPKNVDENGSDLLGNQLAYELLKDYYGDDLRTQHPKIDATYEQLFFYARGIWMCVTKKVEFKSDVHSPDNIRANVIVQLSEFQFAFDCSEDSRMIRSKTETCNILGEGAPETKRR